MENVGVDRLTIFNHFSDAGNRSGAAINDLSDEAVDVLKNGQALIR
jgi:hypothetical protein